MSPEEEYDQASYDYSTGQFQAAIEKFEKILEADPGHFEAQLALGMSYYRLGDFPRAIAEGHKAERLRPNEQLVHTNLSLFYMKAGDKTTAEHHGLQARIASWKTTAAPDQSAPSDSSLELARPVPAEPVKLPSMPWKKNKVPPGPTVEQPHE